MNNIPQKILTETQLVDTVKQVYEADLLRHRKKIKVSKLAEDIVDALVAKYKSDSGKELSDSSFPKIYTPYVRHQIYWAGRMQQAAQRYYKLSQ